ncbi:MAG TPA: glycosyltransferase [Terracidiphilus sp.]|nr:glycosyltransferase [Terracidiphilus sp.]
MNKPQKQVLTGSVKKNPLVTIGMPVYNCRATVAESIASILNQTLEDWELVVFDDGSRDGTHDVVRRFADPRIRLIVGKTNRGLPARLIEIVRQSRSTFFARMDGDDTAYPDRLQQQVDFLRNHPEIDLVAGAVAVIDGNGEAIGVRHPPLEHERICARPYSRFPMAHPTWLGRTDWFRHHPYREDAVRMEDWDLLFRAHRQSRFANLQEIVLGVSEASLSLRKLAATRWNHSLFVIEYSQTGGAYLNAMAEVGGQALKLTLDAFALGTGLNHRVLRHRIPPISRHEKEQWREVRDAARTTAWRCLEGMESVPA